MIFLRRHRKNCQKLAIFILPLTMLCLILFQMLTNGSISNEENNEKMAKPMNFETIQEDFEILPKEDPCPIDNATVFVEENRQRLRRQLPVWRRVVLMITFLDGNFENLDIFKKLYGTMFAKLVFCTSISNKDEIEPFTKTNNYLLVHYDGFKQTKSDRSYECFQHLYENRYWQSIEMESNRLKILGILSIMDDVLVNFWNLAVVNKAGRASSMMRKIWSPTNGAIFVAQTDTTAGPYFIGNSEPLITSIGSDLIGTNQSYRKRTYTNRNEVKVIENATGCRQQITLHCSLMSNGLVPVWNQFVRYFRNMLMTQMEMNRTDNTRAVKKCWNFMKFLGRNFTKNFSSNQAGGFVGQISADFFYLPTEYLHKFVEIISIFRRQSLHREIAIPTALSCLVGENYDIDSRNHLSNRKFIPISDAGKLKSSTTLLKPWLYYSPSQSLPFTQPIKFNLIEENAHLKSFLCRDVFQNFYV